MNHMVTEVWAYVKQIDIVTATNKIQAIFHHYNYLVLWN